MGKRVLLKLSGETCSDKEEGKHLSLEAVCRLIDEIKKMSYMENHQRDGHRDNILTCELAIVIGGGNIFRRSVQGEDLGMDDHLADHAGMVSTIVNGLVLLDALEKNGFEARLISSIAIREVAEDYVRRRVIRHLEKNRIVILTAGTGNTNFTTDSAMVLRGIELGAHMILKGTKVDGIYSDDPIENPDAVFFPSISSKDFLDRELKILDAAAVATARDKKVPIHIFNIFTPDNLKRIIRGDTVGSVLTT